MLKYAGRDYQTLCGDGRNRDWLLAGIFVCVWRAEPSLKIWIDGNFPNHRIFMNLVILLNYSAVCFMSFPKITNKMRKLFPPSHLACFYKIFRHLSPGRSGLVSAARIPLPVSQLGTRQSATSAAAPEMPRRRQGTPQEAVLSCGDWDRGWGRGSEVVQPELHVF